MAQLTGGRVEEMMSSMQTSREDDRNAWGEAGPLSHKPLVGTAALQKAFDLIDIIGGSTGFTSLAELMRRTGMPRATLYRMLAALSARGLIRHDPTTQGYCLGFHLIELAQNVWSRNDLVSVAATELRRLRDMTGETSYLAVLHEGSVRSLGRFDGAHSRRSSAALGANKPLHCTSQGKAILSHMSQAQVRALLRDPLQRFTDRTITDIGQLLAHLEITQARGFATDDEEIRNDTRCVGAAILDPAGYPIAAISVAGPSFRITSERAAQLGPELAAAAERISSELNRGAGNIASSGSTAQPAAGPTAFFGSSCLWSVSRQEVAWIDRRAPAAHWTSATTQSILLDALERDVDAAVLEPRGMAVFSAANIVRIDEHNNIERLPLHHSHRVSAARVDEEGQVWLATFDPDSKMSHIGILTAGAIDKAVWTLEGEVSDMVMGPDPGQIFVTVPERHVIYVLSKNDGRKRIFSRFPSASGQPIGLAMDSEGRLWVAAHQGWSLIRLDADGELERVLPLPVPAPTSLAFGGPDLRQLYVATARIGLSSETLRSAPLSGRLLRLDVAIGGLTEPVASAAAFH